MNDLELNGVKIPTTPENMEIMRKALEEYDGGEEMEYGDEYWFKDSHGEIVRNGWCGSLYDEYRSEQDNCLSCKHYTQDQAEEYFNKRDARRAAETKLRKIIADLNKKDGFVANFDIQQENWHSYYNHIEENYDCSYSSLTQLLPTWRYSSKATAEFINENHADLLDIYLERE